MILSQLKALINFNQAQNNRILEQNREIILQNKEIIWAQIFHDSIKGKPVLENLPLFVGRWAGNYTLFYVLYRILNDFRPERILELGLGESSKFISVFIQAYLANSTHLIIEQDEIWKNNFVENFDISNNTEIFVSPLKIENVQNNKVKVYSSLNKVLNQKFDFYLIDGPNGSEKYSRYDAFKIAKQFNPEDNFILLIDDFEREGEKDTVNLIRSEFQKKKIEFYMAEYTGLKSVLVIGSKKYKNIQNF